MSKMTEIADVPEGTPPAVRKKLSLTTWILIALVAGILTGIAFNNLVPSDSALYTILIDNVFYLIGKGFIRLMQMLVAPLVFCSIVCGAASIGSGKTLGKVGGVTVVFYLLTTTIAICLALGVAFLVNPGQGLDMSAVDTSASTTTSTESTSITDTLLNIIPTNIFGALADGTMLQIIFFALILGVILAQLGKKVRLVSRFFAQGNDIMMKMVNLVLKVAPIGVFCLIANTFAGLGLSAIVPVLKFIGGTYLALFLQLILVYMVLLAVFTRLNPFRFLRKMVPVLGFAFSTSSSNATIPLNIETLEQKMGVSPRIASFTIPLGATINMDGTAIMQGVAVVFVAQAFNIDLGAAGYATVILTAVLASIGTAGVPGVGTIMLAMVFNAVGLPAEGISMVMGVDRLVDMGRTAINVTGDAVVTTIVAKFNGALDKDVFNADNASAELVTPFEDDIVGLSDDDIEQPGLVYGENEVSLSSRDDA